MADRPLKSLNFPGLADRYIVPQKTSDLTNDSEFQTKTQMNTALAEKADTSVVETAISTLYDMATPSAYNNDKVPYLFRPSGGGKYIGGIEKDSIVGGTVAWNQLLWNGNFESVIGFSPVRVSLSANNNVLTMTVTEVADNWVANRIDKALDLIAGHKYFMQIQAKPSHNTTFTLALFSPSGVNNYINATANTWNTLSAIETVDTTDPTTSGTRVGFNSQGSGYSVNDIVELKNYNVFDLTQMFGSTIADYIYSLEQATAGSGIAKLKSWGFFTEDYYPYDAGSLKSVESLTSHDMVGFNQWDEEWEVGNINSTTGMNQASSTCIRSKNYIPVLPDTQYYYNITTSDTCFVFEYDANYNPVVLNSGRTNVVRTTASNTRYLRFRMANGYGTTYNHDICINISDTSRNGQYEPYQKNSYALDSSLTLRGILKMDSDHNLYYDGDRYEPDGTVERRYAEVDLGTLNWTYSGGYFRTTGINETVKRPANNSTPANAVCSQYQIIAWSRDFDKSVLISYGGDPMLIKDTSYTDATTFKEAMSGVMLTYELATPTTETATPYQTPQIVDKYGTEEYVTTGIVPVGHDTAYYLDADSVLTPPNTAGTYSLKVTVASDGSKSYSWVSD